jgi:DNA-binding response OmpR family regulator
MNHKVLLADDSLTIQKVIKITLANQPYDMTDCPSDEDLFRLVPIVKPELVFLDFNLSEKFTGYELCSKIKALHPSAQVLLLLGTFDTVDDAAMEKCGAADKIVKPFDSNKFISICKRLVDNAPLEELKYPEIKKSEAQAPQEEDQWQVSHTIESKLPEPINEATKAFDVRDHLNPLDQEVSDWGMSVPNIIDETTSHDKKIDLPPVMKTAEVVSISKPISVNATAARDEIKFPDSGDLDYPSMDDFAIEKSGPEDAKPTSKLISVETFHTVEESPIEFEIEHTINAMVESDVSSIEAQIRDEVEEDLWQVDEFEDLKKQVAKNIEQAEAMQPVSSDKFDEDLFKPLDENEEIQWAAIETTTPKTEAIVGHSPSTTSTDKDMMNQLRAEMDDMIKKHVKEYMDQMFQAKVEKISWEVIPDLAENLIKKEISKISNKILNE